MIRWTEPRWSELRCVSNPGVSRPILAPKDLKVGGFVHDEVVYLYIYIIVTSCNIYSISIYLYSIYIYTYIYIYRMETSIAYLYYRWNHGEDLILERGCASAATLSGCGSGRFSDSSRHLWGGGKRCVMWGSYVAGTSGLFHWNKLPW